jgi:hypothetical protein
LNSSLARWIAAGSRRGIGQLARLLFGERDEIAERVHRQRRANHQHVRRVGDEADELEVLLDIEAKIFHYRRIDRKTRARSE